MKKINSQTNIERQKFQMTKNGLDNIAKAIEKKDNIFTAGDFIEGFLKSIKGEPGKTPTNEELIALIKPLIPKPVKGKDGHTPTDDELLDLIKPLIPIVKDGKDGKTPTNEELTALIKPLIQVIDTGVIANKVKDEVIKEIKPMIPKIAPKDTAEELIEKLKSVKKQWLSIEAIDGDFNAKVDRRIINGAATSLKQLTDVDYSGLDQDEHGNYILEKGGDGLKEVTTDATLTGDGTVGNPLSVVVGPGGVDQFTELLDTPDSYVGQAQKFVRVNGDITATIINNLAVSKTVTVNGTSQVIAAGDTYVFHNLPLVYQISVSLDGITSYYSVDDGSSYSLTIFDDGGSESATGSTSATDGNALVFEVPTEYEVLVNKTTNVSVDGSSDIKYPTAKAVKTYADGLVAGLLDYRGAYNASGNTYPTTGGSGTGGAVNKGDMWVISVAGTLGGVPIQIGDSIIANVDSPGQTASNWNTLNTNIGYVPEDSANKVTSLSGSSTDVQYPSAKLVYDQLALKIDKTQNDLTKEPTGFTDPANITVSYDSTARTVTLTGTVVAYFKGVQVTALTNGWVSDAHTATNGIWYLYYNGSAFVWSQTAWTFDMLQIAYVIYGTSDKYSLREVHGVMPWQAHQEFHQTIGTYSTGGGDMSGYTLSSTTAANRRPAVSATTLFDEDLQTINASLSAGTYTQHYVTGAGATSTYGVDVADIVPLSGNQPYYNQFTGGAWRQTLLPNNNYMNVWLVAVPTCAGTICQKYRYLWIQGQTASATLATIQALTPSSLNLGQLVTSELLFIGRVIIRYTGGNWVLIQVDKLTGNRLSQVSAPAGSYLSSVATSSNFQGDGTGANPLDLNTSIGINNGGVGQTGYRLYVNENGSGGAVSQYGIGANMAGSINTTSFDVNSVGVYIYNNTVKGTGANILKNYGIYAQVSTANGDEHIAGYFTDGTRYVKLADGTNALDLKGGIKINGSTSGSVTLNVPAAAGSNTLTVPASTGTLATNNEFVKWYVATADATMSVNNGTIANKGTLLSLALPTTSTVGESVRVAGMNAGLWKITQAANQYIKFGNKATTTGASGYVSSTLTYDCIELVCIEANLGWVVTSSIGNITIA